MPPRADYARELARTQSAMRQALRTRSLTPREHWQIIATTIDLQEHYTATAPEQLLNALTIAAHAELLAEQLDGRVGEYQRPSPDRPFTGSHPAHERPRAAGASPGALR